MLKKRTYLEEKDSGKLKEPAKGRRYEVNKTIGISLLFFYLIALYFLRSNNLVNNTESVLLTLVVALIILFLNRITKKKIN